MLLEYNIFVIKDMIQRKVIEYILHLTEKGSFTKAAKDLYVSQPAFSRKIIEVEKELGTELFDRNQNPVKLTYAGEKYLDACLKILAIHDSMKLEIADIIEGESGRVRFGLSRSISKRIAHIVLPNFKKYFPKIYIEMIEKPSHYLEEMVYQNKIDIAIIHYGHYSDLYYEKITADPLYLAVPEFYYGSRPLHRGINSTPIDINNIKDYPFILLKEKHSLRTEIDAFFEQCQVSPPIFVETESIEVSNQLVKANMGFAFTLRPFILESNDTGVYCPIKRYNKTRPIQICMRNETYRTKAITALIQSISDALLNNTQNAL